MKIMLRTLCGCTRTTKAIVEGTDKVKVPIFNHTVELKNYSERKEFNPKSMMTKYREFQFQGRYELDLPVFEEVF